MHSTPFRVIDRQKIPKSLDVLGKIENKQSKIQSKSNGRHNFRAPEK